MKCGICTKWWNSDIMVLLKRLLVVYVVLFLCRIVFYLYNASLLGPVSGAEWWSLFKGALVFDTASILYINALFVLLSLLPLRIREKSGYQRVLFVYWIVVNGVAVVINLADAIYFHYTQKRFTSDEIFFASNDNSGRLILKFAAENWYLVAVGAVLIAAMIWVWRRCGRPRTPIAHRGGYMAVGTLFLLGAIALVIGGIRGGFGRSVRPITLSNATLYTPSPDKANLILSNPFCIIRTLGKGHITYTKYYTPEELESIFTPCHYPNGGCGAGMPGVEIDSLMNCAGPGMMRPVLGQRNIVIFVLESFSAEHSALLNPDLYPDGKGFTPFLDSLMLAGYTFTSGFANGHKSIEALPAVFSSIPSFKTPFVLLPQSLGPTRGLPKILSEEGYATAFFCGSPRGSMGFGAYATASGITRLYSQEDYEAAHGTEDYDGYWGIWDEPFLGFMEETLGELPQPFFASVFTLSSHHPFVVPEKYKDSLPEGHTRIHKGVAYTDLALRRFFEQAARTDWFRNTIFVFTADHVSSEIFAPKTHTPIGRSRIVLFLYTPDGALRGMDNVVAQQTDLMPTLLGLIGYDKPYFAFGRDILGEPERLPMAVNYANQNFQAITDSVVIYFDEEKLLGAYARNDTLQQHNLLGKENEAVRDAERRLKAVIQQYYRHLEAKDYLVK